MCRRMDNYEYTVANLLSLLPPKKRVAFFDPFGWHDGTFVSRDFHVVLQIKPSLIVSVHACLSAPTSCYHPWILVCSGSYSVHPTVIGGATRACNNCTCCTSDMCCSEQITASQLVWYVYLLTSSVLNF